MAQQTPRNANGGTEPGIRVELPRSCDAIGVVLRDAFEREMGLPDDMASLLRKLSNPAVSTNGNNGQGGTNSSG